LTTKSKEESSDLTSGHTSRPYKRLGIYFLLQGYFLMGFMACEGYVLPARNFFTARNIIIAVFVKY